MAEGDHRHVLSSIFAAAGLIIVAVVIVWVLAQFSSLFAPWLSSLFRTSPSTIEVIAPGHASSGEPFTVSWNYETREEGAFAFLFECKDGLQIGIPSTNDRYGAVPCETLVTLDGASTSIAMLPLLAATSSVEVPISILFIPKSATSASPSASGLVTVTVVPSVARVPPPVQSEPIPTPRPTTEVSGPADLVVTLIRVAIDPYGNGTAVFDIRNAGGTPTGVYYFTANLPTRDPYTYSSPSQTSLLPGSHVESTLRFTQAANGTFSVTVDPANSVRESNESNNSISQYVTSPIPYDTYPRY